MWTPARGREVGKKIMGENETLVKQTSEKLKSLIAGRILSCAPLAIILILILISTLSSVSFNFNAASRFSQIMNYTMMHVTGTLVFLLTIPSFICCTIGLALLIYARKKGGRRTIPFIVLSVAGMVFSALFSVFLFYFARGFESTTGQLEKLSKTLQKTPIEIAKQGIEELSKMESQLFSSFVMVGPYLNAKINV